MQREDRAFAERRPLVRRALAYARVSRPFYKWFFAVATFLGSYAIAEHGVVPAAVVLFAVVVFGALAQTGIRLVNDHFDADLDRDQPDDPYPETRMVAGGEIERTEALIVGLGLHGLGALLCWRYLSGLAAVMYLGLSLASYLYSRRLKWIFPLNSITINVGYGLFPMLAGLYHAGAFFVPPAVFLVYLVAGYFVGSASNNIKDITDVEGDRRHGVTNLATLYGARTTILLCTAFLVLGYVTLNLSIALGYVGVYTAYLNVGLVAVVLGVVPGLLRGRIAYRSALPLFAWHNIAFLLLLPLLHYASGGPRV